MELKHKNILGIRFKIPPFSRTAPEAASRLYDESFAIHADKLWNILPRQVTVVKQHEQSNTSANSQRKKNTNSLEYPVRWPAVGSSQ